MNDINREALVSVLMTVYNREQFIAEAIESVLTAHYKNIELIIVDDCSTDDSVAIARQYEQQDERVRVYINEANLTDYPNRNRAASYAKGKYLKYLDSDDVLYPYGLSTMVNRMEQFPEAALGLTKLTFGKKPLPVLLQPSESFECSFLKGNFLFGNAPSSAIIRHDAFLETGGFSGLNQLGDMEYWLKLASRYPIVLIEGFGGFSRDHENSERYKDSVAAKDKMRHMLKLAALNAQGCPLGEEEKKKAVLLENRNYKRNKVKQRIKNAFQPGRFR